MGKIGVVWCDVGGLLEVVKGRGRANGSGGHVWYLRG